MPINPIIIKDAPEEFRPFLEQADNIKKSDDLGGVLRTDIELDAAAVFSCEKLYEETERKNKNISEFARQCFNSLKYIEDKSGYRSFNILNLSGFALFFIGSHSDALARLKASVKLTNNPNELLFAYATISHGVFDNGDYNEALLYLDKALALAPKEVTLQLGKADVLVALGRYSDAIAVLDKIIELEPKNLLAWMKKCILLGKDITTMRSAIECFQSAIGIIPPDSPQVLAQAYIGLAAVYGNLDKDKEALAMFEKAISISPDDIDAQIGRASAMYYLGKTGDAVEEFKAMALKHPNYWKVHERLGFHLFDQKKYKEAAEAYKKSFELNPKISIEAEKFDYRYGMALKYVGDFEKSIFYLNRALKLAHNSEETSLILADRSVNLLFLGRNDKALKDIEAAININPKSAYFWAQKAHCLMAKNKFDDALSAAKQALKLDPKNCEAHYAMGEVLFKSRKSRKMKDALTHYEECLKQNPNDAQTHARIAHVYLEMGNFAQAEKEADRALEINPNQWRALGVKGAVIAVFGKGTEGLKNIEKALADPEIALGGKKKSLFLLRSWRGLALLTLDKDKEALEEFTFIIKARETSPQAYNNAGIALTRLGRIDEAIEYFKKTIGTFVSREAEIYFKVGTILFNKGKTDEAIKYLKISVEMDPSATGALFNLGLFLSKAGKLDEAENYLKKVIEKDPDFSDSYSELGMIMVKRGDLKEAITLFDKAIEHAGERFKDDINTYYYNKALALIQLDKHDDAVRIIDAHLASDPDGQFLRGLALMEKGKYADSILWLDKAIKGKPDFLFSRILKTVALFNLQKFNEALEEINYATTLDPKNAIGYFLKGLILIDELGELAGAEKAFKKATELSPREGSIYYYLAKSQFLGNKPEQALSQIDIAIAGTSGMSDPYLLKAKILLRLGRYAEAWAALDHAIDISTFVDPKMPMISETEIEKMRKDIQMSAELAMKIEKHKNFCAEFEASCGELKKIDARSIFAFPNLIKARRDCLNLKAMCGKDIVINERIEGNILPQLRSMKVIDGLEFDWFKFKPKKNFLEGYGPFPSPITAPSSGPLSK